MPDFAISTVFKGKDQVSPKFKRMGKSAAMFGDSASDAFRRASRAGSRFGDVTKGVLAAGAIQRGLGLIQQGMSSVVTQFVEFDDAATAATVRFKDIGPHAVDFATQMGIVKQAARAAGAATEFTAAQSAQALDFLARAGFTSAEAMGSLASMINLATATGEDFAAVADYSSDLLGAFGLAVDDTGQKIANLNRLNDVLVQTANTANVTVENMFETMKVAAPIATKYGASLEEVAALTAIMGSAGIKGSQGATALKNTFTRLAAPTKEVIKGLEALGLAHKDLTDIKTGRLKDMTAVLGMVGDRLDDVAQPKQLGILKQIFGAFALAGGANLVGAIKNVDKFKVTLDAAGGTAQATADIMRRSLGNRIKALGSAATEMGFKFLSAFDHNGRGAIIGLTEAVRSFDMTPVINAVKLTADVFGLIYTAIRPIVPLLPVLAAGWALNKAIMSGIIALGWIKFAVQLWKTTQLITVAQAAFNAVMAANPVGLVVVAVAALVAGMVLLANKFPPVKAALMDIANALRPVLDLFLLVGGAVADLMARVFGTELQRASNGFEVFGQIATVALQAIAAGITAILTPVRALSEGLKIIKNLGLKGAFDVLTGNTPDAAKERAGLLQRVFLPAANTPEARVTPATTGEAGAGQRKRGAAAPNQAEVQARQQVDLRGRIDINGAAQGSTASFDQPNIKTAFGDGALLGANH